MRHAAADQSGVRFDRTEFEAAARKDPLVGVVHFLIAEARTVFIGIETVGVFHDEFAPAHQTETGTDFIAELGLDLVAVHGELSIGTDLASEEVRDDFLMRGAEAKIAVVPVLASK